MPVRCHSCVLKSLKHRTDESSDQFWALIELNQRMLHVQEASLRQPRKRPKHYEDGTAEPYF